MFATAADLQVGQKITSAMAAGTVDHVTRNGSIAGVRVVIVTDSGAADIRYLDPADVLEVEPVACTRCGWEYGRGEERHTYA